MKLTEASKEQVKMRLNISAPSGAGKTFSALLLAYGIVSDWKKIAVIDSENKSAMLYSDIAKKTGNGSGKFQHLDLQAPYSPERYIQALDLCEQEGIEVVIIDSSTHEWSGAGGCCDINDALASAKYRGNTWAAWSETTPRHDKFINKILQSPMHIITCTRSKTETVQDGGKVKKIGMKDLQREGWEYELTVSLNLDRDSHTAIASKDRTGLFSNRDPFVITSDTGREILEWCQDGVEVLPIEDQLNACRNNIELAMTFKSLTAEDQRLHKGLASELKDKFIKAEERKVKREEAKAKKEAEEAAGNGN